MTNLPWPEILETNVAREPNTGCWLWMGSSRRNGYGQYRTSNRNHYVHRLSYETFVGPIPEGHHLHHICETRLCLNPQHLKPLSPGDHLRETLKVNGDTYLWTNRQRYLSHCRKGHEFTAENTYWTSDGKKRYCRACIKIKNDERPRKTARRRRAAADATTSAFDTLVV